MNVKERLARLIGDYYLKHREKPKRITVSQEVAAELDAAMMAADHMLRRDISEDRIAPCQEGRQVTFRGIQVVADLPEVEVLDVR